MKKIVLLSGILAMTITPVFAQEIIHIPDTIQQESMIENMETVSVIHPLQKEWARVKYQVVSTEEKLEEIHKLEAQADQIASMYPKDAEVKIWQAIILSTDAGIVKGLSALGKVEKAKTLLEESMAIDAQALDGSAYTSLGSLYYQVPGWPISFGSNKKAEEYLKKALVINPEGIDPNFFYGDFLLQQNRYDEARVYFERALMAKDRVGRDLADAGRRQEIKAALVKLNKKSKNTKVAKPDYN